jgi:alkanesulfonate monooxygenase
MSEYDLDGWTVSDLVSFGDLRRQTGRMLNSYSWQIAGGGGSRWPAYMRNLEDVLAQVSPRHFPREERMMDLAFSDIAIYSTCPCNVEHDCESYVRELLDVARWTDDAGCRGALVFTDCTSIDAWMVAQETIVNTAAFVPLVAVQPMDMTPFALAKAVASLAMLYGRRVDLNFVSGGYGRDLAVQGDDLRHDARYDRLTEYVAIVRTLLGGGRTKYEGRYYTVRGARLLFPPPADLMPIVYVSGSSEASVQAAESLGVRQLSYPLPPGDFAGPDVRRNKLGTGIRIGIIARDDSSEAWRIARKRFPVDPENARKAQLLFSITESSWQAAIGALTRADEDERDPYWLVPFRNYHTFCPYLVGSYGEVARAVGTYLSGGVRAFILDVPQEPDDLLHARIAIQGAVGALKDTAS